MLVRGLWQSHLIPATASGKAALVEMAGAGLRQFAGAGGRWGLARNVDSADNEGLPLQAADSDTFPLDDTTWCAMANPSEGPGANLVIAPEGRRADLDGLLAWVVDRRFAWPVRWGELNLVEDAETAAAELA